MHMNTLNAFNQNIIQKYIELEKNYLLLKNKLEGKNQMDQNYKTELCKKFQTTGFCPYGSKCRFAHGKGELITKIQGTNYKKEKCKTFYEKGYCLYGTRCKFQHDERKFKDINISYFYLRLFLLKYFGFFNSNYSYFEKASKMCNHRLSVFESLTQDNKGQKNNQSIKDDYFLNIGEKDGNCSSTKSNNSIDDKVGFYDFYQGNIFKTNNENFNNDF